MRDEIFENFLKRHSGEQERTVPKDLFQVAVFYFRPASEEIDVEKEEVANKLLNNSSFFEKGKVKYALRHLKDFNTALLEGQAFSFPFYSEDVFMSPKEAENYIPVFVKKLIKEKKIPEDSIKEHRINYEVLETGIVPLNLASLEKTDEFKDIKIDL